MGRVGRSRLSYIRALAASGLLRTMTRDELTLYLCLVLMVPDLRRRYRVSRGRLRHRLGLTATRLDRAWRGLARKGLVRAPMTRRALVEVRLGRPGA